MDKCKRCGSYAVNPNHHGREPGVDLDLCEVCYWRKRYEEEQKKTRRKCSELNDKTQYKFQ